MYIGVLISSDKTTVLVVTRNVEYYPIYLSIGNSVSIAQLRVVKWSRKCTEQSHGNNSGPEWLRLAMTRLWQLKDGQVIDYTQLGNIFHMHSFLTSVKDIVKFQGMHHTKELEPMYSESYCMQSI